MVPKCPIACRLSSIVSRLKAEAPILSRLKAVLRSIAEFIGR